MSMPLSPHEQRPGLTVKDVAKYSLLPGVVPRVRRLARAFENILFVFTQIFGTIGLIERDHPCLRAENIGHYRFADVLRYAMSNLRFTRAGIPQILMFLAVIASIVLLIAIFFIVIAQVAFPVYQANAQFFGEPQNGYEGPEKDHVMRFLSSVFGPNGFFADSVVGSNGTYIKLLTGMLKGYSMALLVIACFMIMYLLIVTAVESAKTGEPFGSRFDGAWAPIRLALGIGLLVPISSQGYNGAQMVAFQTAEWGSNLATNLWLGAIDGLEENKAFFAAPQPDPGYKFIHDYFMVHVCMESLKVISGLSLLDQSTLTTVNVTNSNIEFMNGHSFDASFCGVTAVTNPAEYLETFSFPRKVVGDKPIVNDMGQVSGGANSPFPRKLLVSYRQILDGLNQKMIPVAATLATEINKNMDQNVYQIVTPAVVDDWVATYWSYIGGQQANRGYPTFFTTSEWNSSFAQINEWYIENLKSDARYGWSTAGVFYLRLGKMFEMLKEVVQQKPVVTSMPRNFKNPLARVPSAVAYSPGVLTISAACYAISTSMFGSICPDSVMGPIKVHRAMVQASDAIKAAPTNKNDIASVRLLKRIGGYNSWTGAMSTKADYAQNEDVDTEHFIKSMTEVILDKIRIKNTDITPLSTVVAYGNGIMTASTGAFVLAAAIGYFLPAIGNLLVNIGQLLFIPGFVLAIVVPFLPFMYFMFAVIEWVISVLEAVIGMPLWALSFISLEGDALGKGMQGVMMLFELMLRPSIIIIALISSIIIFTASIMFFNSMFALFRSANETMTDTFAIDIVRSITYLFMYLFIIYSIATSSFKLIDVLPNNFMRWIGGPGGFGGSMSAGVADVSGALQGRLAAEGLGRMGKLAGASAAKGKKDRDDAKAEASADAMARRQAQYNAEAGAGGTTNNYTIISPSGGGGGAGGGRGTGGPNSRLDRGQGEYTDFEDVDPKK